MEKSRDIYSVWGWFAFGTAIVLVLALTLIASDSLNALYQFWARVLPVDPVWVKKNATEISNVGHLVSCFTLTCLGIIVFRGSYFKPVVFVAGLAMLGEFLQEFTATRQANVEDVALGFAGIVLASLLVFLIQAQRCRH